MRQIRQMLRLAGDGVTAREIGRTLGAARSTIQDKASEEEAAVPQNQGEQPDDPGDAWLVL